MADTADLDTAARYAVDGVFGNQGEVCNAGSRLLVQREIHDAFVDRFIAIAAERYLPGDPLDPATTMGSLVDAAQQRQVLDYVEIGHSEGANLRLGGGVPESCAHGAFVAPTLFTEVTPAMRIAREEIFGPVAGVLAFADADEAVALANDSIYGLAAGIWTRDVTTAHKLARDVEAGVVWVNCFDHGDMTQPWGGYKQSGFGRDKCFETILQHTQTKSVWLHLPD
jgi:gamma-glutamyl-gamma-aminobutyraldehyde dehydrogenase